MCYYLFYKFLNSEGLLLFGEIFVSSPVLGQVMGCDVGWAPSLLISTSLPMDDSCKTSVPEFPRRQYQ